MATTPTYPVAPRGVIPPDPVAPDALRGVPRQQTNPARWQGDGRGALAGEGREAVVLALAREVDGLQRSDRERVARYLVAATPYLEQWRRAGLDDLPLLEAHARACELADRHLPRTPENRA